MQVLLNQDVPKLGYRGDIIKVKDGYFRNYLWPRGLAQVATGNVLKLSGSRKEKLVMKKQQVADNAKDVLKKLKGLVVTLNVKVSEKGKLYASVTEHDVIEAVKVAAKVELSKDFVKMEHFKDLGEHSVLIHLGEGLEQKITVVVAAE